MQDPKKLPKFAIGASSHNSVGLYLRNQGTYRQSEKNLLSSNMSFRCPRNMVNIGPLTAEIGPVLFGAPQLISTGFTSWQRYCTACSSERQPNFAALNRGRQLRSAGRPSGWALAHILVVIVIVISLEHSTVVVGVFKYKFEYPIYSIFREKV